MHAAAILQKILHPVSALLDVRNARNLSLAVEALIRGRRLTLMELARHLPGAEFVRAPLKRLDRLLGNTDVHAVRTAFYALAAQWTLRSSEPAIVVDWSPLPDGRHQLLRAAVAAQGRTITLYEEVHPEAKKNNSCIETAFLKALHRLVPRHIRPVIVTDAGFRGPWFRAVQGLGWHWIGRVHGRSRLRLTEQRWLGCDELYARATPTARSLGAAQLAETNPLHCCLVLMRRPRRGRVQLTHYGTRARNARSLKMAARAKKPWLLAASPSLGRLPAQTIVKLYGKRMQIEQGFRDLKSHRYGCGFEDSLTRQPRRVEMLLLIHMLASLAAWLVGLAMSLNAVARVCLPALRNRYSVLWLGWARLRNASRSSLAPPACPPHQLHLLLAPRP